MGVFARGRKLWITWRDVDGKWRNATTGLAVGQEELAQAAYEAVVRQVREASGNPIVALAPTVREYVKTWLVSREKLDLDWKNDRGQLEHHVLPAIGDTNVADVRTRHIVDLFARIRTTPLATTEEPPAPRTVRNIYCVTSALFRDAKLADLIAQSPCCLNERQLGPKRDKDPEWRAGAVFTRDEAETHHLVDEDPADRRSCTRSSCSPASGPARRRRCAGATTMRRSARSASCSSRSPTTRKQGRTKGTKTETVKHVPVHPDARRDARRVAASAAGRR